MNVFIVVSKSEFITFDILKHIKRGRSATYWQKNSDNLLDLLSENLLQESQCVICNVKDIPEKNYNKILEAAFNSISDLIVISDSPFSFNNKSYKVFNYDKYNIELIEILLTLYPNCKISARILLGCLKKYKTSFTSLMVILESLEWNYDSLPTMKEEDIIPFMSLSRSGYFLRNKDPIVALKILKTMDIMEQLQFTIGENSFYSYYIKLIS